MPKLSLIHDKKRCDFLWHNCKENNVLWKTGVITGTFIYGCMNGADFPNPSDR